MPNIKNLSITSFVLIMVLGIASIVLFSPGTAAATTLTVAALDSSGTRNYTCDGVDDQAEINTAITALGTTGGTVTLLAGHYSITGSINLASNVSLMGQGAGTVLKIPDGHNASLNVIYAVSVDHVLVSDLKIDGNRANQPAVNMFGIYFTGVTHSTIERCWIENMTDTGIVLWSPSNYNAVTGNNIQSNWIGILVRTANNNTVTGNNFQSNGIGIDISWASGNTITGNTANYNTWGIRLWGASDNTFTNNTANSNSIGIYVEASENEIYNNNFINNTTQAYVSYDSSDNIFNLDKPTGGNYWSNYDEPSEGCNDLNHDNFCDLPYSFTGGQDNLPWTPTRLIGPLDLNIYAAAAPNFAFWDKWTADSTGVASQIRVYGYGTNGNVKVALYSDNGGSPGTVLAKQDTSTAITTNQWNTIILSSTAQVIQGTTYWIALSSDVSCVAWKNTTGAVAKYKVVPYSSWTWTNNPNPSGLSESNAWYLYTQVYGIAVVETTCGDGIVNGNEQCDGGACCNVDCTFLSASTECGASSGVCDIVETCTGSSATCPTDLKSTAQCRASAGDCDLAEVCDGVSNACPADAVQPAQTECRASAGVCDVAEVCDGSAKTCPTDSFLPDTTLCRASGGVCDIADYCSGSSASCTVDAKSNAECRASAGVCDIAESCDGINNNCPTDQFQPSGTSCNDGLFCNVNEVCDGSGSCGGGTSRDCSFYNISAIGICTNNPDNNPWTWDFRNAYTSTCNENSDSCTSGDQTITYTCNKATCGAQCDQDSDCIPKLVGDSCNYGGTCNTNPASCLCNYRSNQYCPTPGTINGETCYYGTQSCTGSGCGLTTKAMGNYDTCDSVLGPIDTIPHGLYGFLPPANSGSVFNRKQNSTIPLKFQYTGPDGKYITNAVVYTEYRTIDGSWTKAVSTSNPTTSNLFRYDSSAHQYIFNLATKNLPLGSLMIRARVSGGGTITGTITLR